MKKIVPSSVRIFLVASCVRGNQSERYHHLDGVTTAGGIRLSAYITRARLPSGIAATAADATRCAA
jgi:hypothetical protein